jgi:titin
VTATSSATKGVVVSWDAPTGNGGAAITGYKVFRARTPGAEKPYATVTCSATACTYTNKRTQSNTMYFYKVAAVNGAGMGPSSTEVSALAH